MTSTKLGVKEAKKTNTVGVVFGSVRTKVQVSVTKKNNKKKMIRDNNLSFLRPTVTQTWCIENVRKTKV